MRRIARTDATAPTIETSAEDDAENVAPRITPAVSDASAVQTAPYASLSADAPASDATDAATDWNSACSDVAAVHIPSLARIGDSDALAVTPAEIDAEIRADALNASPALTPELSRAKAETAPRNSA